MTQEQLDNLLLDGIAINWHMDQTELVQFFDFVATKHNLVFNVDEYTSRLNE